VALALVRIKLKLNLNPRRKRRKRRKLPTLSAATRPSSYSTFVRCMVILGSTSSGER